MKVSFLTVHFGDIEWTSLLLKSIFHLKPHAEIVLGSIGVVDNARNGEIDEAIRQYNKCQKITFPLDETACRDHGHDHHVSLMKAIPMFDDDILIILDCDSHIVSRDFYQYLFDILVNKQFDAIAASDPRFEGEDLSHPCFLCLNTKSRKWELPLDPKLDGNRGQTARLTGSFLKSKGLQVHVPRRLRVFSGVVGDLYDEQVYHHGSATFLHSDDYRLTSQVKKTDRVYANAVLKHGRFNLRWFERLFIAVLSRIFQAK